MQAFSSPHAPRGVAASPDQRLSSRRLRSSVRISSRRRPLPAPFRLLPLRSFGGYRLTGKVDYAMLHPEARKINSSFAYRRLTAWRIALDIRGAPLDLIVLLSL